GAPRLEGGSRHDSAMPSPVLRELLAEARPDQAEDGITLFLAMPLVASRIDHVLAEPPGLGDAGALAARFAAHRQQVHEALGEKRISQLAARVLYALTQGVGGKSPAAGAAQ